MCLCTQRLNLYSEELFVHRENVNLIKRHRRKQCEELKVILYNAFLDGEFLRDTKSNTLAFTFLGNQYSTERRTTKYTANDFNRFWRVEVQSDFCPVAIKKCLMILTMKVTKQK